MTGTTVTVDPAATRTRARRRWPGWVPPAIAGLPIFMLLVSLVTGGGPRTEIADDALLTLAMRDAAHRVTLVGPYSRFGWHHPGPIYLDLAAIPTALWGGRPTGTWVAAVLIALGTAVGLVLLVRRARASGSPSSPSPPDTSAEWWCAAGVLLAICGLGPALLRDPWNPYVVILPVLFTLIAAALALTGVRGALIWAAVAGTFAVQTHLSSGPVVIGVVGATALVCAWRRRPRRADIPASLPALPRLARGRPAMVGAAVLVALWLPPLWDELFSSHNLTSIWDFFTQQHAGIGLSAAWRQLAAVFGIVLFQHHAGLRDGVGDPHPVVTTLLFAVAVVLAVVLGVRRRQPLATASGLVGGLAGVLAVMSVMRIVGQPYRYLIVWMAVIPVLPLLGIAVGLGARFRVVCMVGLALIGLWSVRAVVRTDPAVSLSNQMGQEAWSIVGPVVGPGRSPVRIVINDASRWPTVAGLALALEEHGHPARVSPPWTLLFGENRRASGREPDVVYAATADQREWPQPEVATRLGAAGGTWLFAARQGPPCWWGWIPMGGPACPVA